MRREQLADAVAQGVTAFGRLTTVCANAGILPMAMGDPNPLDFQDAVDVDLIGVMNAVTVSHPAHPACGAGGIDYHHRLDGGDAAQYRVEPDPTQTMGPGGRGTAGPNSA